MKYQNQETCKKYGTKVKEMNTGYRLDKTEAFVIFVYRKQFIFNLNPVVMRFRKEEEQTETDQDAFPDQCHYLNSPIQYDEFLETLESFASNTATVGDDGVSYQMLNHLPLSWKQLLQAFYKNNVG